MTQCVPDFEFAPQGTFTIGDAVRAANKGYVSHFGGKWHLGSFYNDSARLGGVFSSPAVHGFDLFNATVEVSPTATTNCQCDKAWASTCDFGHNPPTEHCAGTPNGAAVRFAGARLLALRPPRSTQSRTPAHLSPPPPFPRAPPPSPPKQVGNCCFNYWHGNASAPHGVSNHSLPTPDDDATYNADSFVRFLEGRGGAPFLAQISFHNCHIPFVGTPSRRAACNSSAPGAECLPPLPGAAPYGSAELDFYACLNELDSSVGAVLDALQRLNYYECVRAPRPIAPRPGRSPLPAQTAAAARPPPPPPPHARARHPLPQ
jgi:hypothetical protein